jgi:hypothetical protein
MGKPRLSLGGYIVAALLGAAVGGIVVARATKAIPLMASKMMGSMMVQMGGEACNPEEM